MARTRRAVLIILATAIGIGAQCRDMHSEHLSQGDTALEEGRTAEAVSHYSAAAQADSGSAMAVFRLGYALYRQGQFEEAGSAFTVASALLSEPDRPSSLYNLGNALAQQGRLREALSAYRATLRLAPDDDDARYNYALVESWLEQSRKGSAEANAPDGPRLSPEEASRLLDAALSALQPAESVGAPQSRPDW